MELLVIRHAIAMEREEWARTGRPDGDRPLTDAGRRRMRKNARGIQRFAPHPDVIATSPFLRAADTARVVAELLGIARMETVEALLPDRPPAELAQWLNDSAAAQTIAVVGHEPHLGALVTWLISGRETPAVEFKKGGACLLQLDQRAEAGTATMQWLLTASQLRAGAD
ncbi:MAG TPA: histidine phosphatase family protein [Gemmatimonadaceae bacterium]